MEVGTKLKNGAIVLAYKAVGDRRVVAARWIHDQSFVTWQMDAHGNCYWGHYYPTQAEAMEDFEVRA